MTMAMQCDLCTHVSRSRHAFSYSYTYLDIDRPGACDCMDGMTHCETTRPVVVNVVAPLWETGKSDTS